MISLDEKIMITSTTDTGDRPPVVLLGLIGSSTGRVEMTGAFGRAEALELAERIRRAADALPA